MGSKFFYFREDTSSKEISCTMKQTGSHKSYLSVKKCGENLLAVSCPLNWIALLVYHSGPHLWRIFLPKMWAEPWT